MTYTDNDIFELHSTTCPDEYIKSKSSDHVLNDNDIKKFIAHEINRLNLNPILNNANDDKTKRASEILFSLRESCSSLNFKVNQEIFGYDPSKSFNELLNFWIHSFVDVICINIRSFFYNRDFAYKMSGAQMLLKTIDVANSMSFDDYFQALEELKKEDEKQTKECDQYCPSIVMPVLKKMFPTLVSEEEILSAISEFKLPEM